MSAKKFLDNLGVNSPCTADWDSMIGNDQVRFCKHCALSVNNLSEMTHKQNTALEYAALSGNREMVRLLLSMGADVNDKDKRGQTPLMMLDGDATSDLVWDLINAGAKVNLKDKGGDTALTQLAGKNNVEVLRALLEAGAKVDAKNNGGRRP